ncbi:hypothetical protein [Lacticaseibacillus brantae]|uniref:hypothetical protein n=1 Tax=Lacticaseibacillus brantae TaxID=943673 RepID=UPI000709CAD5|nr:hypothetical protein [Lacticaseibacillus brantae]
MDNKIVKPLFLRSSSDGNFRVGTKDSEAFKFSEDITIVVDWETHQLNIIDMENKTVKSNLKD